MTRHSLLRSWRLESRQNFICIYFMRKMSLLFCMYVMWWCGINLRLDLLWSSESRFFSRVLQAQFWNEFHFRSTVKAMVIWRRKKSKPFLSNKSSICNLQAPFAKRTFGINRVHSDGWGCLSIVDFGVLTIITRLCSNPFLNCKHYHHTQERVVSIWNLEREKWCEIITTLIAGFE